MMVVYKSMLTYIKCALARNRVRSRAAAPHAQHRTPRISQFTLAKRRGSPTRHPVTHGHLKKAKMRSAGLVGRRDLRKPVCAVARDTT